MKNCSVIKMISLSTDKFLIKRIEENDQKLLFDAEVNFQSKNVKFSGIIEEINEFLNLIDDKNLVEILSGSFSFGSEIRTLNFNESLYTERTFEHVDEENEKSVQEIIESVMDKSDKKPILKN